MWVNGAFLLVGAMNAPFTTCSGETSGSVVLK